MIISVILLLQSYSVLLFPAVLIFNKYPKTFSFPGRSHFQQVSQDAAFLLLSRDDRTPGSLSPTTSSIFGSLLCTASCSSISHGAQPSSPWRLPPTPSPLYWWPPSLLQFLARFAPAGRLGPPVFAKLTPLPLFPWAAPGAPPPSLAGVLSWPWSDLSSCFPSGTFSLSARRAALASIRALPGRMGIPCELPSTTVAASLVVDSERRPHPNLQPRRIFVLVGCRSPSAARL
jgi:hypothetical protein